MNKSEFKEYLKTEILNMTEVEIEVDSAGKAAEVAKEIPDAKIKLSEFKNFLREEILQGLAEQEDETSSSEIDAEEFDFDKPEFEPTGTDDIDDITDGLVELAKKAKDINQIELANQILNSAKFSSKTQFKDVEKKA
jgi:hypothetical protein